MKAPRRYRWALGAYPAAYRDQRADELLTTLADGDDDRGRASTREAAALAYRGLLMRAHVAALPAGLLVVAAGLILGTGIIGFEWAERHFLFDEEVSAMGTDGPSRWPFTALVVSAWVTIAVVVLGAIETRRRRRAVALTVPLFVLMFVAPGRLFLYELPGWSAVSEYLVWAPQAVFANRVHVLMEILPLLAGTWLALRVLARLRPETRERALAAAMALSGAVVVADTWARPDLPAAYARSAFADLEPATFITAFAVLLAVIALIRGMHPGRPQRTAPDPAPT